VCCIFLVYVLHVMCYVCPVLLLPPTFHALKPAPGCKGSGDDISNLKLSPLPTSNQLPRLPYLYMYMYMTFIFLYKSLPLSLASVACTPARRLSLYLCIHSYITWQCRKSRVRSCAAATARLVEKGNTTPARRNMCIERESLKRCQTRPLQSGLDPSTGPPSRYQYHTDI